MPDDGDLAGAMASYYELFAAGVQVRQRDRRRAGAEVGPAFSLLQLYSCRSVWGPACVCLGRPDSPSLVRQTCEVRWMKYEDAVTGTDLLAACLPVFELANGVRTIPRRRAVALYLYLFVLQLAHSIPGSLLCSVSLSLERQCDRT